MWREWPKKLVTSSIHKYISFSMNFAAIHIKTLTFLIWILFWQIFYFFYSSYFFFFLHSFCVKPYVPREPRREPSNRRLNEHGIYIRHCQESNSQPVSSQAGADTTRPQWRKLSYIETFLKCIWLPALVDVTHPLGRVIFNKPSSRL